MGMGWDETEAAPFICTQSACPVFAMSLSLSFLSASVFASVRRRSCAIRPVNLVNHLSTSRVFFFSFFCFRGKNFFFVLQRFTAGACADTNIDVCLSARPTPTTRERSLIAPFPSHEWRRASIPREAHQCSVVAPRRRGPAPARRGDDTSPSFQGNSPFLNFPWCHRLPGWRPSEMGRCCVAWQVAVQLQGMPALADTWMINCSRPPFGKHGPTVHGVFRHWELGFFFLRPPQFPGNGPPDKARPGYTLRSLQAPLD